jgi:DNA-binding transcriptional regulator YdaS (Cro superfamily)
LTEATPIPVHEVRYVKELYPRLKPLDEVIERYRDALDNLPPITIARGGVLVDGYHRWQAHVRENVTTIAAVDLGDLSDAEIVRESIRRNATHGQQLSRDDKKRMAGRLWAALADLPTAERVRDIADLLAVSERSVQDWTKDERRAEKQAQQDKAWDLWLECADQADIANAVGVSQQTVSDWLTEKRKSADSGTPPESRQHFDVWQFATTDRESGGQQSYFGAVPPQVLENLLWFFTEPGHIVVDLFAGSGTTVDVAKRMGRRVWAADIRGDHYSPHLPIHAHDATTGWPEPAPRKADLVFLDPPYWQQAVGRYSSEPNEMAEMDLEGFTAAWSVVVKAVTDHAARVAYIISPTQLDDGTVVDHATAMLAPFIDLGWRVERRIIVPYSTQQATGQQVTWARDNRRMLKLYRDLVVLSA